MGITGQVERYEVLAWLGDAKDDMTSEQVDEFVRQAIDAGPQPDAGWEGILDRIIGYVPGSAQEWAEAIADVQMMTGGRPERLVTTAYEHGELQSVLLAPRADGADSLTLVSTSGWVVCYDARDGQWKPAPTAVLIVAAVGDGVPGIDLAVADLPLTPDTTTWLIEQGFGPDDPDTTCTVALSQDLDATQVEGYPTRVISLTPQEAARLQAAQGA